MSTSRFTGAAPYYRLFRPGIPPEAVAVLNAETDRLGTVRRLLDLGTGTGQVPAALHAAFTEIDAVEADAGMLTEADAVLRAAVGERTVLRLHHQHAEDFTPPYPGWSADMVTICRAFHWMDQPVVLDALDRYTAPAGVLAVMGDGSLWTARTRWTDALRELIQDHLGPQRRAGTGTFTSHDRSYADVLADSPFPRVEKIVIPVRRVWNPEQVIGYLYSTSFAAQHLFGERLAAFETAARRLLDELACTGPLVEPAEFQILLARREAA
ncbi:trans-aconitate 2-methyltransferase [Planomonospora sp. ID82291]|uniref:class I SAM-dependent methyltransferase n=1 Tax=Planomonospora sp. ID82291 TaxID=2738136 RepID=UPI0018C39660|nr:class I SAM-dependent methyltransferase [Planomonospora sp. ID82291]MBG0818408.1 class I SAM-dependent methyltransferase [Planomonospora sp. ID82291]